MRSFSVGSASCNGVHRARPASWCIFASVSGADGAEKILAATIDLHGDRRREKEVVADTTTQENNITFPTDT